MKIAGIDPGFTGGIAIVENGKLIASYRMPVNMIEVTIKGKTKKRAEYDIHKIVEVLKGVDIVAIEKVAARPNQGVTSMFRFGEGYGILQGVTISLGKDLKSVPPRIWKKYFNLSSDKDESQALAISRSEDEESFKFKADNGRAEAFLIGLYSSETLNN